MFRRNFFIAFIRKKYIRFRQILSITQLTSSHNISKSIESTLDNYVINLLANEIFHVMNDFFI